MADFIKCNCSNCGAKYRLPVEFQGRRAKCKKCGEKFEVPKEKKTLEDSVLDWLSEAEEQEFQDEEAVAQPRVINIPKNAPADTDGEKPDSPRKGPIRMKSTSTASESDE